MDNSQDFMNYLHEDKLQRLRHDMYLGHEYHKGRVAGDMVESPFARLHGANSTWVAGGRYRDINQS